MILKKLFHSLYWHQNFPAGQITLAVALIFGIKKLGILKFQFQIFKSVLCDVQRGHVSGLERNKSYSNGTKFHGGM